MSSPGSGTGTSTTDPAVWSIRRLHRPGAVVLVLGGEMDSAAAPALRSCLMDGLESGADVVVDLADATLLDCACLGALVRADRRAQARGRRIVLAAPRPVVRRVLRITELDTAFPVLRDRHEALPPARKLAASV